MRERERLEVWRVRDERERGRWIERVGERDWQRWIDRNGWIWTERERENS
jgi:hypothetical protein